MVVIFASRACGGRGSVGRERSRAGRGVPASPQVPCRRTALQGSSRLQVSGSVDRAGKTAAKWRAVRTAKPCGPDRRCYGQAFADAALASTGAVPVTSAKVTEARTNSAPGRARHKPSDHCAGKAVCTATPVCRCAVLLRVPSHSGPWVPAGTRPSLRPLASSGRARKQSSGELSRENAKACLQEQHELEKRICCLIPRHCERSDLSAEASAKAEAIQSLSAERLWIASAYASSPPGSLQAAHQGNGILCANPPRSDAGLSGWRSSGRLLFWLANETPGGKA